MGKPQLQYIARHSTRKYLAYPYAHDLLKIIKCNFEVIFDYCVWY
jgi:hypothetical protein